MSSQSGLAEQARISVKLIGSKDLDYIAEPLTKVINVSKRPYFIFEAQADPTLIQTIAITILPHSIPVLKEVGRVVFDELLGRALEVFEKMPGKEHLFTQDFKVDRKAGTIDGRISMRSDNVDLMRKTLKLGREQYEKALELMSNDSGPDNHFIVYGIELDESSVGFRIRRKDVTTSELKECD